MRRSILVAVAVLVGCGQAIPSTSSPPPPPSTAAQGATSLNARPLKLPVLAPGAGCPVTPVASISAGVRDPRGRGPFYLGGPMPRGAFPWNKTVYIVTGPAPSGPILFRGGRIDGAGRLQFSGDRASQPDPGVLLTSDGGVSDYFYDGAFQPAGGGALYVFPSTTGCYAIQVDAPAFEDVIVLAAG